MATITFLGQLTKLEAQHAISQFALPFLHDWKEWETSCLANELESREVVNQFGRTLRRWKAGRPQRMRRPQSVARHDPPFLDDLVHQAFPYLKALESISIRDADNLSPEQNNALKHLWLIFSDLTYPGKATCVGITKATMLLTHGRFGPALDKMVRKTLRVSRPGNADEWLEQLKAVSRDIKAFEEREHIAVEMLVPEKWRPVAVGRAYDMAAWGQYQLRTR